MSAVFGILSRTGGPVQRSELDSMLEAASNPGMEKSGRWVKANVALAHQSYSFDDATTLENFPAPGKGRRSAVTFDGRLDNIDTLARRLGTQRNQVGLVLLAAYRRWGTDCVDHLEGDFAFIIWDGRRESLFFARDRIGARSLCYFIGDQRILVASEVRHLLDHQCCRDLGPNETKAALVLASSWVDQEQTFFDRIRFCPPGSCGTVGADGQLRVRRYWQPDTDRRLRYRTDAEYAEHFDELFRRSVARRLPQRGAVGLSLSGGPDSAAVAAAASSILDTGRLKTFSYVFDRYASCDERPFIDQVVEQLDLDSTFLVGDDHGPLVQPDDRVVFDDCGTQDPYIGLVRQVIRAARSDGCNFLLTGHYADLLFAGGDFWAGEMLADRRLLKLCTTVARHRRHLVLGHPFRRNPIAQVLPPWLRRRVASRKGRPMQPWMMPDLSLRTNLDGYLAEEAGRRDNTLHGRARRLQHLTHAAEVQGRSAVRELYNSAGIESVDPFFDVALIEMVLAMPADQLGRPHLTKWALRCSQHGKIPEAVRLRSDKTTLFELFEDSLTNRSSAYVGNLLKNPQIVRRGWVDGDWLRNELQSTLPWKNSGYRLWQCISLEMWLQKRWPS